MKLKHSILTLLILISIFGTACKKEPVYTTAELNAIKIQETVDANNIYNVSVYERKGYDGGFEATFIGEQFLLEGTFLAINNRYYYSLENVYYFECVSSEQSHVKYLRIYFD